MVKNPPVSARDSGDSGLISGLKGSPGGGSGDHSSILAWKIPQTRGTWWMHGATGPQSIEHD